MDSNVKANRTPVLGRRKVRHPLSSPTKPPLASPITSSALPRASEDLGTALLAVELALTGDGPWATALTAINKMPTGPDTAGHPSLFHGAPAQAFALDAAGADDYLQVADRAAVTQARLAQTARDVDLERLIEERLAAATARVAARHPATTAELGLTDGMLGLGVILLRRAPGSALTQQVIDYIAGLTAPVSIGGVEVPGWYVAHDPAPGEPTPGGHVNLTMASGAAGLLAFLATAVRAGYSLDSLRTPIQTLLDWLLAWQQPASAEWPDSPWWPRWVTPAEIQAGRLVDGRGAGEPLPSWSRMAGIARAIQMGAGVLASKPGPRVDDARAAKALAEEAMLACLTDRQVRRLISPGLWGGLAGLYQAGHRAAGDASGATELRLWHRMSAVGDALRAQIAGLPADTPADLWTGESGVRLAAQTLRRGTAPTSRWDALLLITGNPRPLAPRSTPWS